MSQFSEATQKKRHRDAQRTYRQKQQERDLVRLELQVEAKFKDLFDSLVRAKANDFPDQWAPQRRIAQARRQVLQDALATTQTSFIALTEQVQQLKAEIRALSPNFFKTDAPALPLPQAIANLPDDPDQLKKVLARLYQDLVTSRQAVNRLTESEKRYRELYEALDRANTNDTD